MKKIWRYSLCLACTLALSLCSAPAGALAAEPEDPFVVEDGVLVKYTGEERQIVIPADRGILEIGSQSFYEYYTTEYTVVISVPEGVTCIGDGAFSWSGLTEISLPSTLREIKRDAFGNCFGLNAIDLPIGLVSIGSSAFLYSGLQSLDIPDRVVAIGNGAFAHTSLESIVIPDSVTEMGVNLFEWSTELTSVTLPSSLTEIPQGTFWNCRGLTDVSIPESVTVIGNFAFAGCESLPRLFLPDGVTKMEKDTFYASDFPLYCRDGTYAADFIEQNGLHRGYYGDVNEDGRLNSSDARLVLQHTVELVDLSPAERLIADISDDGEVNSTDARRILQAAVAA